MKSGHEMQNSIHLAGIFISDRKLILGILFAALVIRILFSMFIHVPLDSVTLAPLGLDVMDRGASLSRSPLGFFFLRTVKELSGESCYTVLFVIQSIISTLTILLIYYITRRIQSGSAAVIAAMIAAVFPNFIIYCFALDTKNLCVMLVAVIAAVLVSSLEDRRKAALAGMATGLAILLEPVFLLFMPGIVFVARKRLLYLAVSAAILLPWTVWNSVHSGNPVPVFDMEAYEEHFSFVKFTEAEDIWETSGSVYANFSALMIKSWEDHKQPRKIDNGIPFALENRIRKQTGKNDLSELSSAIRGVQRNAGYAAAYSCLLVMFLGVIGFLKYYKREHRFLAIQFSVFLLLLVLLTTVNTVHRAIVEVYMIIFSAVFISASTESSKPFSCR